MPQWPGSVLTPWTPSGGVAYEVAGWVPASLPACRTPNTNAICMMPLNSDQSRAALAARRLRRLGATPDRGSAWARKPSCHASSKVSSTMGWVGVETSRETTCPLGLSMHLTRR